MPTEARTGGTQGGTPTPLRRCTGITAVVLGAARVAGGVVPVDERVLRLLARWS
jgi:hypothetical protein